MIMTSSTAFNFEHKQVSVNFDTEFSSDPASGSFFNTDFKKHEDLKHMLDSTKDGLKLESMKRIIGMVARGKDVSDLFPAVVKNVVSSNLEVKKLVYVYLVRYAEEQQDLALLSISSFQRGLKDPNPLIRACALRVLSSIRVHVIVPIMLLAIKETVTDLSPYVRKTTAHAIPKLFCLDPEQKDELVTVIEKLLSDMSTLVVGSAVMAFEEVCPERIDLIHTNYKKLCCLLVDVEEWGQIIIINMLTRYARTQFLDPNAGVSCECEEEKPFYDDQDLVSSKNELTKIDRDHRLLLTNTKPLLQSRNAAVVLSVAQLYQHVAPHGEVMQVARALVRLLRSHREVQAIVLTNIASLSTQRKGMFEPFLKSFFVRSSDPTHIKILKLEVITNLATELNITIILREFQTYIWSNDKEFVASTIQAIGRCSSNIKEVTDSCLNGLVMLLSNKDESVVGESVVVVRKLLQSETVGHKDIITHMARLVDNIRMPTARASILWLLGEYCDKVPKIAPDVLRKMAKSFVNENDLVKLQIITLATKLYLTNPKQTHLLCQYIFNLAKYDASYDIRDRVRFIRALIFPASDKESFKLCRHSKKIFLATKIPPVQYSNFKDRIQFQLGTLSHVINARANGYCDLPVFPEVASDPSVRDLLDENIPEKEISWNRLQPLKKSFYPDDDSSLSEKEFEENLDSDIESKTSDASDSDENYSTSTSDELSSEDEEKEGTNEKICEMRDVQTSLNNTNVITDVFSSDSLSSDYSTSSDDTDTSECNNQNMNGKVNHDDSLKKIEKFAEEVPKSNIDLLLDFECTSESIETPILIPSSAGCALSPTSLQINASQSPGSSIALASPAFVPSACKELINRISGYGLSVHMRFTRSPHLFSHSMTSIELLFKNNLSQEIKDIHVGNKRMHSGMTMHDFSSIPKLLPDTILYGTIGIDFNDSITPAAFDIIADGKCIPISITPNIGDLIDSVSITELDFHHFQMKLKGMNEHSGKVGISSSMNNQLLINKLYEFANLLQVPSTDEKILKFGGQTSSSKLLVLVSLCNSNVSNSVTVTVNCEKMLIASMLYKHIESALANF